MTMVIFEISLNGEVLYRVGGHDLTRSSVLVDAWGRLGDNSSASEEPRAGIEAFGKTEAQSNAGEVRKWEKIPLGVGDAIQIRLLEGVEADEHTDVQALNSVEDEQEERWKYLQAKKLYLKLRDKYETKR